MKRPEGLPDALWARAVKRTEKLRAEGKSPSLMSMMQLKLELSEHLPRERAFAAYLDLIGNPNPHGSEPEAGLALRQKPLASLGAALADSGASVEALHEGGKPCENRVPIVYGPAEVPGITAIGRRVSAGWLEDVMVYARSAMIRQGARLLFDADPEERDALPVEMAFDPVIFRRLAGDRVDFIDDLSADRCLHLPAAISLLGINSVSFGHWMLENLPRFLAARKLLGTQFLGPDAPPLPVLIDEDMPAQHAQSLMFFGRGGGPELIRVPRGHQIKVDRLYAVQNFMFAPHLLTTDRGLDYTCLRAVMSGLGAIYTYGGNFAGRRIEGSKIPAPDRVRATRRLFWARKPTRHRSIANWDSLRARLEERGYVTCFPEEMSFARQVAAMRAADRIVVQNGSGSLGLLLAKPGTRLLYLSHPDMPRLSFQVEAHACTDVELRVLAGQFTTQGKAWVDQSNYRIDMRDAEPALEWLEEGMGPAPAEPPKALYQRSPDLAASPQEPEPLPDALRAQAERVRDAVEAGAMPELWDAFQFKARLAATCRPAAAQRHYIQTYDATDRMQMRDLPVVGLLDRLRQEGQDLALRDTPNAEMTLSVAKLVGPGTALKLTRVPRVVAGGWLDGAQVFSRSNTILHEDAVLLDRQEDEADRVRQELASDAVLFGGDDRTGTATFIDETRPDRQLFLSSAWSLLGQNTAAFGHWSFETLAAFLTWRDRPDLDGTPLLVDQDLPPQHKESLALLANGRFPIVPVPPGGRVFVSRLFAATSWYYTPHLMTGDPLRIGDGFADFNVFGANAQELGRIFRTAGEQLDARGDSATPDGPERLYLARHPDHYRKLTNADKISALLTMRGFQTLRPEELGFAEQIRAVRAARQIVCQAGSLSHLAFFARSGTQMCLLHHPGTRTMAMVSGLLQEIGIDLTLAVGRFEGAVPTGQGYADRADYSVPAGRVAQILDGWHSPLGASTRTSRQTEPNL